MNKLLLLSLSLSIGLGFIAIGHSWYMQALINYDNMENAKGITEKQAINNEKFENDIFYITEYLGIGFVPSGILLGYEISKKDVFRKQESETKC